MSPYKFGTFSKVWKEGLIAPALAPSFSFPHILSLSPESPGSYRYFSSNKKNTSVLPGSWSSMCVSKLN
jgi:hypothetical protein